MPAWFTRLVAAIRTAGAGTTLWTFLSSPLAALYLWGPLVTAWGFIAGWHEGIPTPYLLAASTFTMGSILWASSQATIWRDRNRVKDRLYFRDISVGVSNVGTKKLTLKSVQIGVLLESAAEFPIDFIVDQISSSMDGRINANPSFLTRDGTVVKGRPSYYRDTTIPMDHVIADDLHLKGQIKFKIRYGRNKKYRYPIEHVLQVELTADKTRPGQFLVNWSYLEQ